MQNQKGNSMQAQAISKYVRISPYKLRPYVDVVRGNRLDKALAWLKTCSVKRVIPIIKTIVSAYSNAKNKDSIGNAPLQDFIVKEIRIDAGPVTSYFKPGAMGRASMKRKRVSHVHVVVEKKS
jgi:large subunit ribosomal protein L22